jgi:peptidoglycan biosynthesis protein MviN/MurJ (putative lipid II flippase)
MKEFKIPRTLAFGIMFWLMVPICALLGFANNRTWGPVMIIPVIVFATIGAGLIWG